ncbi:hypothetical protein CsSME_00000339 [Camellia sinensis var. sinensis]
MGAKETVLFLIILSFHFYHPPSLFSLANNLPSSALLQKNVGDTELDKDSSSSTHGGGNGIAHHSNYAYSASTRGAGGGSRGASGGRSGGSSEEGNGGSSTTPNTAAGTAVIPLYAAGAANGHRNTHHGAGSCNQSCVDVSTLCALILASLVVHIYVVLGVENLTKPV